MGFSREENWSGVPLPSPRDLPDPGIELRPLALQADSLPSEPPGKIGWDVMDSWMRHDEVDRIKYKNYATNSLDVFTRVTNSGKISSVLKTGKQSRVVYWNWQGRTRRKWYSHHTRGLYQWRPPSGLDSENVKEKARWFQQKVTRQGHWPLFTWFWENLDWVQDGNLSVLKSLLFESFLGPFQLPPSPDTFPIISGWDYSCPPSQLHILSPFSSCIKHLWHSGSQVPWNSYHITLQPTFMEH